MAIEEAYAAMAAAKTLTAWNDADVKFHFAILQAAGNELLVPLGLVIEIRPRQHVQLHRAPEGRRRPHPARP